MLRSVRFAPVCLLLASTVTTTHAALLTDPDDARSWQGANVGTFAGLYFGANNATTRQQVIDGQLLDDGWFDATGYAAAQMIRFNGIDMIANPGAGSGGRSLDQPGVVQPGIDGTYAYDTPGITAGPAANGIDQYWVQTNNTIGATVFDLGFAAAKAAVFNTIDHGPLPQEAIESTVYLSNDLVNWFQAVTERVWLEGIYADTSVLWDGFVYAVGAPNGGTFRYASVIWGGPGALQADGDNEINGLMGLRANFDPGPGGVPEPTTLALVGTALLLLRGRRYRAS